MADGHFESISTWLSEGYDLNQAVALARYFRAYRRRFFGAHGPGRNSTAERLNRVRYGRRKVRQRIRRFKRDKPRNLPKKVLLMKFKPSPLLDGFYPDRKKDWQPVMRRIASTEVELRQFSFIDSPVETIERFRRLAEVECRVSQARLNFSDFYCLDIGAFLLLEACWRHLGPIFYGGAISSPTQRVLEAVGLRAALGMAPFGAGAKSDGVVAFPIQRNQRPGGTATTSLIEPERSEKVSDLLCEWIDRVLGQVANQALTEAGLDLVQRITGEALDNAQTHSDPESEDGVWTVAGFVAYRNGRYRFHLSFLSIGVSIAESVRDCPEPIKGHMEAYVRRHRRGRNGPSEGDLRTVFALQDGVTRLHRKLERGAKGGTGLADVMEFFHDLAGHGGGAEAPVLAIVSGSTYVKVAPPYSRALRESVPGVSVSEILPRRIWFNPANSETQPPDSSHVFSLPVPLNGTLVTMAFDLDRKYLEDTVHDD
jgi:hypothetical protein